MGKAETKNKNVAMAAYMKAHGVTRSNATCPTCSTPVSPGALIPHMRKCGGNYRPPGRK